MITVRYSSIDHYHQTRRFKTLEGARKYAVGRIGEDADVGSYYAVSFDGVGKITVDGCTIRQLFAKEPMRSGAYEVWALIANEDGHGPACRKYRDSAFATLAEANEHANWLESEGGADGAELHGTTDEARDAIYAQEQAYRAQLARDREEEEFPF